MIALGCLGALSCRVSAGDWTLDVIPAPPAYTYEVSAGADGVRGSGSVYGSLTSALFGDIRDDGWRVRTSGGYGLYRYVRAYHDPALKARLWPEFRGTMLFADALLGYQLTTGPLTVKAFAGMTQEQHELRPGRGSPLLYDDENAVQGDRRGFKGALETWLRLGSVAFAQTDVSWSSPFESYGGRLRLGYRLGRGWSVGAEAAVFGNLNHDHGRAGAFVRLEGERGEISLSLGADGDQHEVSGAYSSLALLWRF